MFTEQINMLRGAEVQFRLASAVHLAAVYDRQPLDVPLVWTHGEHEVFFHEVALTAEGAKFAEFLLQRSATYLLAVQIKEALSVFTGNNALKYPDVEVSCAFVIANLIRNGFAHQPLEPVWKIAPPYRNKRYDVSGIIRLDTSQLDGKPFDWRDYGGPLALLRLSEHVRTKYFGDNGIFGSNRDKASVPGPNIDYRQQGPLILKICSQ